MLVHGDADYKYKLPRVRSALVARAIRSTCTTWYNSSRVGRRMHPFHSRPPLNHLVPENSMADGSEFKFRNLRFLALVVFWGSQTGAFRPVPRFQWDTPAEKISVSPM